MEVAWLAWTGAFSMSISCRALQGAVKYAKKGSAIIKLTP